MVCHMKAARCREMCNTCYGREWRSKNMAHYKAYQKAYNEAHPAQDKEAQRVYSRRSYLKHREQVLARAKQRYQSNPAERRAWERSWITKNRGRKQAAWRRWDARKRGATGNGITAAEWEAIKSLYNQQCTYCGSSDRSLTQDHIVPLSSGGSDEPGNIVAACKSCNSSKGKKEMHAWKAGQRFASHS